jgi:hypothetical protein
LLRCYFAEDALMKVFVRTVLGLIVVLGWWTFTGNMVSTDEALNKIPPVVWGGGAGRLEIEAETTSPARMMISFGREDQDDHLESYEDIGPGTYRWSIDVPSGVGGMVELNAVEPKPGDRVRFAVRANGRDVFEDSDQLEQALQPGYAFFVQAWFDDYAKGELSEDD